MADNKMTTCGDCVHADVCARVPYFSEFSRDNPAYCNDFKNIADHAEVVRCKDCINYNPKGCSDGFGWCEAWDQGRMDHNFCHCGERKDNE